jgi:DNA-damage-inducible protein J
MTRLETIKTTDVRARVEPELKDSASDVLAQCGLTVSEGIRLFMLKVVATQGLPFDVNIPNAATKAAMNEARAITKARFASSQEIFNDLEKNTSTKARKPAAKK